MRDSEQAQYEKMVNTPVPKLVMRLAAPTIVSMLINSIYNLVDTFFVAKLGTSAAGAVGIVFSLMALIQAVGYTLGMGAGSLVSRLLGEQEEEKACSVTATAFYTSVVLGGGITVLGFCFLTPLMRLLGATETILPYARDYARYILLGAPVMCGSFVLDTVLRMEGKAVLSMAGMAVGGTLNVILDPILILGLKLGIAGAALATLISQCVGLVILLFFFLRGKSITKIRPKDISRSWHIYWEILTIGFPSFCRQGLASAAAVALNWNAAAYGDPAVAAMSITGRIFIFVQSFTLGFGQGYQPVAGFNYGAKRLDRMKEAFWFSLKVGTGAILLLAAVLAVFAPSVLGWFRKEDAQVIAIGGFAVRAQCVTLPLLPLSVIANMTFQGLGRAKAATFLSSARQGIFFLPLIMVLPALLGLRGVQLAQPAADLLTGISCIPLLKHFFRELKREQKT